MIANGDILWRRTEASSGANHYGIAVWLPKGLHIIHRQKTNHGVVEPLDKFLMDFPLRGSKPTPISQSTTPDLIKRFDSWVAGPFDLLTNNCEQYAYRFAKMSNHSPDTNRRTLFLIALSVTLIVYFLTSKTKFA